MSRPMVRIHNIATDEVVDREMNAEELAHYEAQQAETIAIEQAEAEAVAKRQALLDKLGITEDEARLLLGGN